MDLEEINHVEIVNIQGRSPIRVRISKSIGMKEFSAIATFIDNDEYIGAWHSTDKEEAKKVTINNLIEQEELWNSIE